MRHLQFLPCRIWIFFIVVSALSRWLFFLPMKFSILSCISMAQMLLYSSLIFQCQASILYSIIQIIHNTSSVVSLVLGSRKVFSSAVVVLIFYYFSISGLFAYTLRLTWVVSVISIYLVQFPSMKIIHLFNYFILYLPFCFILISNCDNLIFLFIYFYVQVSYTFISNINYNIAYSSRFSPNTTKLSVGIA